MVQLIRPRHPTAIYQIRTLPLPHRFQPLLPPKTTHIYRHTPFPRTGKPRRLRLKQVNVMRPFEHHLLPLNHHLPRNNHHIPRRPDPLRHHHRVSHPHPLHPLPQPLHRPEGRLPLQLRTQPWIPLPTQQQVRIEANAAPPQQRRPSPKRQRLPRQHHAVLRWEFWLQKLLDLFRRRRPVNVVNPPQNSYLQRLRGSCRLRGSPGFLPGAPASRRRLGRHTHHPHRRSNHQQPHQPQTPPTTAGKRHHHNLALEKDSGCCKPTGLFFRVNRAYGFSRDRLEKSSLTGHRKAGTGSNLWFRPGATQLSRQQGQGVLAHR